MAVVIEAGDCTQSGNNSATTSWAISFPAYSSGDLLIVCLANDDSTDVTGVTAPSGPNSETMTQICTQHNGGDSTPDQRISVWWYIATAGYAGGTQTFTPSASEQWTATVARVPAGEFDASTPIGATQTGGNATTATTIGAPAMTAGAGDGDGRLCCWFGIDVEELENPHGASGWTAVANTDRGAVAGALVVRDTATTASESISATAFTIDNSVSETGSAFSFIVRVAPPTITDVDDEGFYDGETGVAITGTTFEAAQGTGSVSLNTQSDGGGSSQAQTVTSWGDTSITITVDLGALGTGTRYLFVTNDSGYTNATGYAVTIGSRPTISNAGDEGFYNGETGIEITGTNFNSSQGDGTVSLNTAADGSGTNSTQTVTSWGDTSITITAVQGSVPNGTAYLIVQNSDEIESAGYAVTLASRPTITDADDEDFYAAETGISIDGSNFGAAQGAGYVELNTASDGSGTMALQTIESWGDSQITFTAVKGAIPTGTAYLIVHTDDAIESAGYEVTINPPAETSIASDWDIDYIPNSPLTLAHDDGTLNYDTGGGTAPARDDFIRGATSGTIAQILSIVGTAASGTLSLTNTTARFQDNESLVWMDSVDFDNIQNGGITVGDTITGASSGRSGTVRFIEYSGTSGTAYSEQFGSGSWTNNENIQVGGQTRALANGTGADNSGSWTGTLANGTLTPPSITGVISYDAGTQLIPKDAKVQGNTSGDIGIVHKQFGTTSTGSLRLNDTTGTFQNNEPLYITQVVNYDNQVGGQKFREGDWIIGTTSGATGRVLTIIDDGDSTGRLILADQTGTWDHTTPDDIEVDNTKIAEVENNTFTINAADTNGTLNTIQRESEGGLYSTSLNPVRSVNSFYTYLQDTFEELDQLDDRVPMSGQVKNQQYTLINNWKIPDLSMRFLDSGSIQDENQDNIWTNIQTLGTVEGITDLAHAATAPLPLIYLYQDNQLIDPFWISGHINILVKVKTNTRATADNAEGQLIDAGNLTVYVRRFGHTFDHFSSTSIGGVAFLPLATTSDSNNTSGTHEFDYDNESSGPFTVGEEFSTSDNTKVGIITALDDQGTTGTIDYILVSTTNFANNETFTGKYSGASAQINGSPTSLVAGYTDITFTFSATSQNLNNGNGSRPYDVIIDCNSRTLTQVYEYLKFATRKSSSTTLNGLSGDQYKAVGDIRLLYDGQSGNFTEGLTITGGTSGATGYITADHDDGTSGALILRSVSGTFLDNETITDSGSGSATVNGTSQTISPVKSSPFGTLAGGKFFGARGVWLSNVASADSNNYELVDSTGTQQVPPSTITITINNTEASDRVSIFKTTGDNEVIDRQMFTLQQAHTAPVDYIRVLPGTIPADTPTTGTIRVDRRNASGDIQGEERYDFTSWTTGGTYDEFTLSGTTTRDYDTNDTAYVPYIDEIATGTSVSESITYVSDRYVLVRVRIVGMLPFKVKGQITTAGLTVTTIRTSDSVYQ